MALSSHFRDSCGQLYIAYRHTTRSIRMSPVGLLTNARIRSFFRYRVRIVPVWLSACMLSERPVMLTMANPR